MAILSVGFPLAFQIISQSPAPQQSPGMTVLGIVLMFAVFFFLIILPQSRKAKKQAQYLSQLKKGDAVVTQGGLYGRITGLTDKVATLEIASKVMIRVDRSSIVGPDPFAGAASADEGAAS